jgi:hypothetical protein
MALSSIFNFGNYLQRVWTVFRQLRENLMSKKRTRKNFIEKRRFILSSKRCCGENSTSLTLCHGQMFKVVADPFDKMIKFIRFHNKIIGAIF